MSQENVEVVRVCYEAFARREFPEQYLASDFEWTTSPDLPDAGTYRGVKAVRRTLQSGLADGPRSATPVEWFDVDDSVVVFVHGEFRLTADSTRFESDYAHLWRFADGHVHSVQAMGRAEALEVVGLSE